MSSKNSVNEQRRMLVVATGAVGAVGALAAISPLFASKATPLNNLIAVFINNPSLERTFRCVSLLNFIQFRIAAYAYQ